MIIQQSDGRKTALIPWNYLWKNANEFRHMNISGHGSSVAMLDWPSRIPESFSPFFPPHGRPCSLLVIDDATDNCQLTSHDAVGEIGELQRTLRHGKVQHHVLIVLHNGKFSRIVYSGWSPAHWIIESEDFHVTRVSFCPPTHFRRWRWSSLTFSPHCWECLAAACRVPLASPGYDRVSPKASEMQDDQLVALLE